MVALYYFGYGASVRIRILPDIKGELYIKYFLRDVYWKYLN